MSSSSAPRAGASSPRVLLVDEDIEELASLAAELRQRGVQVALANGVSMACERAKAGRLDVVIAAAELTEAREDGLSLLDALAIELGQLPPILLLVRHGPGPLQGEAVPRHDVEALVARVQALSTTVASRGAESAPPSSIYAGSLAKVSLADVVETLWVDRKTGTLGVTTPFGAGDVRLVDGSIVDAVYLRFEGMKALVRMIGEPEGRFLFSPETPAVLGRMSLPTADLLIEAETQLGETKRLRAQLGDLTAKALIANDGGDHDGATGSRRGVHQTELSPLARLVLAKLRAPATLEDVLDDFAEPDALVLAAVAELDSVGRVKRLAHETHRVPLVGTDQLHLMRALVSRASAAGYEGATRLVFAGTPSRLAVFAHAALCLADALPPPDPPPTIPIPHTIATVRLGDDVDVELIALPLVPAYAPLWPLALAGSAIVVRLDDAGGAALGEACAAAEIPVLDAHVLVGALEEGSAAQVASLVRAAIEATQGMG
jgi:CheY-like chemotaxis protein